MLLGVSQSALAEKADRSKPVKLEADRVTVDDGKKVHVFEGRVNLTQGTLNIRADKIVVTQDAEGFQKGIATAGPGGLAHIRQKLEGKDEYIDGEAERIEHDGNSEQHPVLQSCLRQERPGRSARPVHRVRRPDRELYGHQRSRRHHRQARAGPGHAGARRDPAQEQGRGAQERAARRGGGGKLKSAPEIANPRQENRE